MAAVCKKKSPKNNVKNFLTGNGLNSIGNTTKPHKDSKLQVRLGSYFWFLNGFSGVPDTI